MEQDEAAPEKQAGVEEVEMTEESTVQAAAAAVPTAGAAAAATSICGRRCGD